jgi:hypothetical protein
VPEILTCEQGTAEWYEARLGIPTASEFATVLMKGRKKGAESVTRKKYMCRLAAERVTGEPREPVTSRHLERGKVMEPEARELYEFAHGVECQQVGFIRDNDKRAGCSPDSLVGEDGMLEIKSAFPEFIVEMIDSSGDPSEHTAQRQGNLWLAKREWIDLLVYWPGMPPYECRTYRDEPYIKTLDEEVERFNDELDELTERVRRYGAPEVLPHRQMMKQLQEAPKWAGT